MFDNGGAKGWAHVFADRHGSSITVFSEDGDLVGGIEIRNCPALDRCDLEALLRSLAPNRG